MRFIQPIVDNSQPSSYAAKLRRKRFQIFCNLIAPLDRPIHILDIGGTQHFWEIMQFTEIEGINITILNLEPPEVRYPHFSGIAGDATNLAEFSDGTFDVVFTNSVIEHVGDYEAQNRMATEVQRVGRHYFLQTPNYYFPIEPHFLFPGYQWLPLEARVWLIQHFRLGWRPKTPNRRQAQEMVESIRLLRKSELRQLFPQAQIYEERLLGMVKSFILYA